MTKEKFASIAGAPRTGNFVNTSLSLEGWYDCSLYGPRTYTCDSTLLPTSEEAEKVQGKTLQEIHVCLGDGWSEVEERSSARYVVLHHGGVPLSITLSTDVNDRKEYVVRLTLCRRSN
jgi:hypothetical protein